MIETHGKPANVGEAYIRTAGDGANATVVKDTVGVLILGFLVFILIIALERAHARNRKLMAQLLASRR